MNQFRKLMDLWQDNPRQFYFFSALAAEPRTPDTPYRPHKRSECPHCKGTGVLPPGSDDNIDCIYCKPDDTPGVRWRSKALEEVKR